MRLREGTPRQKALFGALVGFYVLSVGLGLNDVVRQIGQPRSGVEYVLHILFPGRPDVAQAGLRAGSTLITLNGVDVAELTRPQILALERLDRGAVNTLQVRDLDRSLVRVTLPVQTQTWTDVFYFNAVCIGLATIFFCMLVTFAIRPYDPGSWALLVFGTTACSGLSMLTRLTWHAGNTSQILAMGASALSLPTVLHIGFVFPTVHPALQRRPLWLGAVYGAGLVPLAVAWAMRMPHTLAELRSLVLLLYGLQTLCVLAFISRSLVMLRGRYPLLIRQRAWIVFFAVGFGAGGNILTSVVALLVPGWISDWRITWIPLGVLPVALAYLTLRQDLVDAQIAVRRVLVYTAAGGLLLVLVWGTGTISPALSAAILLPVLFVLPRFNARVNRWLYPKRAGFPELRRTIGDELLACTTREDVLHVLAGAPPRVCDTDSGAAFLLPGVTDDREHISGSGESDLSALHDLSEEPLVQMLVAGREAIQRESLRVDPRFAKISQESRACMDRLNASVLLPIERDGKVIGGLAVGPHVSGDVFDPAELDLLRELSHEAVRALEVAQLRERSSDPDTAGATQRIPAGGTEEIRLPSVAGGRFVAERLLGEGGFKRVYLARDTRLQRDVALAMIRPERLSDAGRKRIEREAQAMARFGTHAHIVAVYDIGEDAGQLYIVNEYMPGGDLTDRLAAGAMPVPDAVRIAIELCDALAVAHAEGIVHRDLKPGNVWFTGGAVAPQAQSPGAGSGGSESRAKLGDFGLALAQEESRITEEGAVVGTVAYMAPEQAHGETPVPQSDLYALGVVLYEMLTGRLPFTGPGAAILDQHKHATPDAPSTHNGAVPPDLDALVLQLLAKAPSDRPPTATAVRDALLSFSKPQMNRDKRG